MSSHTTSRLYFLARSIIFLARSWGGGRKGVAGEKRKGGERKAKEEE